YTATYAMYSGETQVAGGGATTDISASMIDAEVGYSMPATMGLRVHVGYHTDTGTAAGTTDNETYSGFHYDMHNNAGLMDRFTFGNLTYMRVGAAVHPSDDVTVGLEYFMFSQTEADQAVDANGVNANTTEDELGNEIDLVVTKKYSNNFSTMLRYGMFQPG